MPDPIPVLFLGLAQIARPLVWLLTQSSNLILRPFGDRTTFTEARLSVEEIEQLIREIGRTPYERTTTYGRREKRTGEPQADGLRGLDLTLAPAKSAPAAAGLPSGY